MSVTPVLAAQSRPASRTLMRLGVAVAALAIVAAALVLVGMAVGFAAVAPAVAPKSPFGTGLREAAPAATGLAGYVLAVQSQFFRALTAGLLAVGRGEGSAFPTLLAVGFAYGVFHAAGPGHGKGVIAGYLLATRRTLLKGLGLSLAAALVQAIVAILLVGTLAVLLKATAATMSAAAGVVETASFAILAAFGGVLLWRKTARLVPDGAVGSHVCDDGCGQHGPDAVQAARTTSWREAAAVVLAAGIRPCSGAILLLVFAVSQGDVTAGIAATLAMALGTALTTGALAALAVTAKALALRLAGRESRFGGEMVAGLETLAAAFVAVLGVALLLGSWSGAGPS